MALIICKFNILKKEKDKKQRDNNKDRETHIVVAGMRNSSVGPL